MNDNWMSDIEYDFVIQRAPLVSIDLIIRNRVGNYLLNYRGSRPAKHKWFFFGGSIKKTQDIETAFKKIISREFKGVLKTNLKDAKLTKVVTHKYKENRYKDVKDEIDGIHYVVLCFELTAELSDKKILNILDLYKKEENPHVLQIQWFKKPILLDSIDVHENVKHYFNLKPTYII